MRKSWSHMTIMSNNLKFIDYRTFCSRAMDKIVIDLHDMALMYGETRIMLQWDNFSIDETGNLLICSLKV